MAILKYESENELYHHGIKGQKWGVRRFQNYNGSYTQAGLKRYYGSGKRYESARDAQRAAKADYRGKNISKADYKQAKYNAKRAKETYKNDYNDLREYKTVDKQMEKYRGNKGKYTQQSVREYDRAFKNADAIRIKTRELKADYRDKKIPRALYERRMAELEAAQRKADAKANALNESVLIDKGRAHEADFEKRGTSHTKESLKDMGKAFATVAAAQALGSTLGGKTGIPAGLAGAVADTVGSNAQSNALKRTRDRAAALKASDRRRSYDLMNRYDRLEKTLDRTNDSRKRRQLEKEMNDILNEQFELENRSYVLGGR